MAATTASAEPGRAAPGLRELKKQRTRQALARAAVELFCAQGYERTTVDEIAAAVDVSQRTFFRYFDNKEEVAFVIEELINERFAAAVRARPAAEPPLDALRNAVTAVWDDISSEIQEIVPVQLYMRLYRLIESTPPLLAVFLRRQAEREERIAAEIALREGLDPETDPRPRVLVAAAGGVVQTAMHHWGRGENDTVESLRHSLALHLDLLGPALAGPWRASDGARAE